MSHKENDKLAHELWEHLDNVLPLEYDIGTLYHDIIDILDECIDKDLTCTSSDAIIDE